MSLVPDLEVGRRFVAAHPPPGRLLLCAVTGSHLYGFPSPNSDLDLKGIHLAPTAQILGLRLPADTHDRLVVFEGVECDLTTHEAAFALRLLLKGNGNLLERLASPLQLCEGPAAEGLRALIPHALSRACYGHYRGYLRGMQREHRRDHRLKSLLYSFRVGLTGIHLLQTGEVQAHLPTLLEIHGFPELEPLIARKAATEEHAVLSADEAEPFIRRWPELEARIDAAREASVLPENPPSFEACDAWLIDTRRQTEDP